MKKVFYLIVLLFFPMFVLAQEEKIEIYKIDITVLENGNFDIKEIIKMTPPYNGFEKNICYKNNYSGYLGSLVSSVEDNNIYDASSVRLSEIRAIDYEIDKDLSYFVENGDLFVKNDDAKKGNYGVYKIVESDDEVKYKIYNSSKMNKDIYINYIIESVAITHFDISEIPINISSIDEGIKSLEIDIHIPNNEELLKIWSHNNKNENIQIIDNQNIKIYINNIKSNTELDFRIVCDKNKNYTKKTNEVVLDKIIKLENELDKKNEENKNNEYESIKSLAYDSVLKVENSHEREDYNYAFTAVSILNDTDDFKTELLVRLMNVESKVIRKETLTKVFYTSLLFLWLVFLILICYQIYKKYDKEYKITFKDKYYKDIPSDISCSSLGYLLRRKINNNDLVSSILNLILNNNIEFKKIGKTDFCLKKKDITNLSDSDLKLIKFIFEDKNSITFSKVHKRVKNNYNEIINNYSNWITKSTIEAEEKEFYEDMLLPKIIGIIISVIGFIMGILLIDVDTYFPSYIILIISVFSFIYFIYLNKKTIKGNEEYTLWMAFMRYLNKNRLSGLDKNVLNKYLMYSISLGNYNKISKYADPSDLYTINNIFNLVNDLLSKAYTTKNIEKNI